MNENQFQADLFQLSWNRFPDLRRLVWAVPNGQYRHAQERALFQATGVVAGVYDLHLYYSGQLYLFELKVGNNKRSDEQVRWSELMKEQGAKCFTISEKHNGRDRFISILEAVTHARYDVINSMPEEE